MGLDLKGALVGKTLQSQGGCKRITAFISPGVYQNSETRRRYFLGVYRLGVL